MEKGTGLHPGGTLRGRGRVQQSGHWGDSVRRLGQSLSRACCRDEVLDVRLGVSRAIGISGGKLPLATGAGPREGEVPQPTMGSPGASSPRGQNPHPQAVLAAVHPGPAGASWVLPHSSSQPMW